MYGVLLYLDLKYKSIDSDWMRNAYRPDIEGLYFETFHSLGIL